MALNREQKRMLKRQGELGDDGTPTATRRRPAPSRPPATKESRTTARVFVKEVRSELRKVAWPSRAETLNYAGVVAVALVILTSLIFVLDWAFSNLVLRIFNIQ